MKNILKRLKAIRIPWRLIFALLISAILITAGMYFAFGFKSGSLVVTPLGYQNSVLQIKLAQEQLVDSIQTLKVTGSKLAADQSQLAGIDPQVKQNNDQVASLKSQNVTLSKQSKDLLFHMNNDPNNYWTYYAYVIIIKRGAAALYHWDLALEQTEKLMNEQKPIWFAMQTKYNGMKSQIITNTTKANDLQNQNNKLETTKAPLSAEIDQLKLETINTQTKLNDMTSELKTDSVLLITGLHWSQKLQMLLNNTNKIIS